LLKRIGEIFRRSPSEFLPEFSTLFEKFQQILQGNNTVLEIIAQVEDKLSGEYIFDVNYIRSTCRSMSEEVYKIIYALNVLSNNAYPKLFERYETIQAEIGAMIERQREVLSDRLVVPNREVSEEIEELVGNKSARLGEIGKQLDLRTPDGFVITTAAYHLFMKHNKLWPEIDAILDSNRSGTLPSEEKNRRIGELFEKATLPPALEREISQTLAALHKRLGRKPSFAVRSSAWGEDGEIQSFAGQFRTLLSRRGGDIVSAYKQVLASRFSESVLAYHGGKLDQDDVPMAVACQEMIRARVSGVVYTLDPTGTSWDRSLVTAVFGLGEPVVSGMTSVDTYLVSRFHPFTILERRIVNKEKRLVIGPDDRVQEEPVPASEVKEACLTDEQILGLAHAGMALERYFKKPQDIEWAIDDKRELYILQSRPLILRKEGPERNIDLGESLRRYPLLLSDAGQIVQRGIAAGKVVRVMEDDDPNDFPQGAIAVTRFTSPRLSKIIRKTSAIVTDVGSPTGHMATIAREFRVPTIVGTGKATEVLKQGMEITVDAEENRIYEGIVPEVLRYQMEGKDQFADLSEFKLLKRILNKVAPLRLIDPSSPDFTAENCRTYHDILRFCHEKAVWELINLHASQKRFRSLKSREMKLSIPIGLYLIDIGNGLSEDVADDRIYSIDQVKSGPMKAILHGLTAPGTWSTEAKPLRFDDFMSSLTRFSLTGPQLRYGGKNLAVISDCYTNLSLRLGYHFNVIDTYVTENINDNYIYFRFVGGVTEPSQRHRRGLLLQVILEKYDFKVMVKNDLVVARIKKRGRRELHHTLEMLGRLIGFTRQLDTEMTSDQSIDRYSTAFLDRELDNSR
jgi:pyruvate,water dikinase